MSKNDTNNLPAREVPPAPQDRLAGRLPEDLKDQKVREQIVCTELLSPDNLKKAQQEAKQLYEKLIQDTVQLMNYGKSAVTNLNAQIRVAQDQVEPVEIDELHQDIKRVSTNMEGLSEQYNPEDPKVAEKIQREVSGKKGLFSRGPIAIKIRKKGKLGETMEFAKTRLSELSDENYNQSGAGDATGVRARSG